MLLWFMIFFLILKRLLPDLFVSSKESMIIYRDTFLTEVTQHYHRRCKCVKQLRNAKLKISPHYEMTWKLLSNVDRQSNAYYIHVAPHSQLTVDKISSVSGICLYGQEIYVHSDEKTQSLIKLDMFHLLSSDDTILIENKGPYEALLILF